MERPTATPSPEHLWHKFLLHYAKVNKMHDKENEEMKLARKEELRSLGVKPPEGFLIIASKWFLTAITPTC
jgi:SpoVK/Ycf46/Vps4 family AAA+-type ATPase